jgi:[ribosomal protein S5]-alanine N-acetyltransferase
MKAIRKTILETERLLLQEFSLKDHPFIIELLNSEGWLKYIGDRKVKTPAQAKQYLVNGPILSYKTNGFGLYKVILKDSNATIGMCGLIRRKNLENIDIGFALLPDYYGNGFAEEIASATLEYGFQSLSIENIVAITLPNNYSSIKLLGKLGMTLEKKFWYEETKEDLLLFRLRVQDFNRSLKVQGIQRI